MPGRDTGWTSWGIAFIRGWKKSLTSPVAVNGLTEMDPGARPGCPGGSHPSLGPDPPVPPGCRRGALAHSSSVLGDPRAERRPGEDSPGKEADGLWKEKV